MEKTLTILCDYLNNYFIRKTWTGRFTISDGSLIFPAGATMKEGQYYRIKGSDLNDGVHEYPTTDLKNETFTGTIQAMAVPETVIDLAGDISDWLALYGGTGSQAMSPFASESFGNYSYSKGTAAGGSSGNSNSWQAVFGPQLAPYRKLRNYE